MCGEHDCQPLSFKLHSNQSVKPDCLYYERVNVPEASLRNCDRIHKRVTRQNGAGGVPQAIHIRNCVSKKGQNGGGVNSMPQGKVMSKSRRRFRLPASVNATSR